MIMGPEMGPGPTRTAEDLATTREAMESTVLGSGMCIMCGAKPEEHHKRGCSSERLERIESKLDFMMRQQARKESVPLAPTAYSALAQAGMDPRKLSTHKVVTLLDDWKAEQIKATSEQPDHMVPGDDAEISETGQTREAALCGKCQGPMSRFYRGNVFIREYCPRCEGELGPLVAP